MPVVSADGLVCNFLVVFLGKMSEWRVREDGRVETPATCLPQNSYLAYKNPVAVEGCIFLE